jgi:epoxyqueuosine reductase QueG
MGLGELTRQAKAVALDHGADLVGVVSARNLPEHEEEISRILAPTKSVMVVASRHSLAAIRSSNNQVAQFDTIHSYGQAEQAAHRAARFLESEGYPALAVPAFIPIDMAAPKKGMRGEICWRRAGVRSGLGCYGENGLLVTREFGAAIRISGLVTAAELEADPPLDTDVCDHCMRCVEGCPANALSGEGRVDKKRCGDRIFEYGFRYFQRWVQGIQAGGSTRTREAIGERGLLEMWQTFMTGNYYYCFHCQSQCPASALYPRDGTIE